MQLTHFHFDLPAQLIARHPAFIRSASRLLCVLENGELVHQQFSDVIHFLQPGDLLVFNDTKVLPARLFGYKKTGGKVEVLVERILDDERMLAQVHASKSPRAGDQLLFAPDVQLTVFKREDKFYELHYPNAQCTILQMIEKIGEIPLPPYMERRPTESDKIRYQTVYAKQQGSIAAPTAGLHFDETLLDELREKKINFAYLTLHIGAGTFAPIRSDNITEHKMHAEYLEISAELCEKIKETKKNGGRIIAVGTTTLRALETASQSGELKPYTGDTHIFITPGYQFNCADALITNLHLPASTLLILVCAFAGYEPVMNAYQEAVKNQYRFYSYGDAMLLSRKAS